MDNQQPQHSELIKSILSGTRWALIFRICAQSFTWIASIIVVRFINPSDYGLNAMLEAPLELLMLLSTLGLDVALVQFKKIEQEDLHSIFGWLLVVNGLLFLSYFFGGALLAAYFNQPSLDLLARVLACVFLLAPFRIIPNALLNRELKFKLVAFAGMTANITAATITLLLAIKGMGIWALVLGVLTNRVLESVILMFLQPWIIMPSLALAPIRRMIGFGGNVAIFRALVLFTDSLASLIAGPVLGAQVLGIYNVSRGFALLPLSKTMPIINPIIFPSFSKLQGHSDMAAYYLEKSLGVISLALFPAMIGMACISEEFVRTILGEKWLAAVTPLALLSLSMPFRAVTSLVRPVMMGMGRIDIALASALFMLFIFIPTVWVGMNYGVIGMVTACLITEPVAALVTLQLSKHVINTSLKKIYLSLRPAICATSTMATCVLWTSIVLGSVPVLMKLIIEVSVGVVSYLLMLKFFFPEQIQNAYRLVFDKKRHD